MREQEAIDRGYTFTGITDLGHNANAEFEARRAALKKAGFKVVTVHKHSSPESRSYSEWRALYADDTYFKARKLSHLNKRIASFPARLQAVIANHAEEIRALYNEWDGEREARHNLEVEGIRPFEEA